MSREVSLIGHGGPLGSRGESTRTSLLRRNYEEDHHRRSRIRTADTIAARIQQAHAEQDTGANHLALMFPAPRGSYWRSSNFDRRVLAPAYQAAGWRDDDGNGTWTWHSLRHVFCTAALFLWRLEATDVSCMAGHANIRVTLDMYVGATAGVLDRARTATQ